ncbi:MAG: glutathione S-transferase family protein [Burkholderiales bacterium]|jgi:glutathione S-transferase|nr:glutathione S-transferase family protein [Burkholderiales bacterium]
MATILYSNYSSYYSMIARLCLAEKAVTYDLHDVDIHIKMEQFAPEYAAMQANMTVPVLDCDGNIITDSRLILYFVNQHFGGVDLFPAADAEAIDKSLELHYAFSIEDLTMGNALRKSPIARIALGRGLARASRRCLLMMNAHPELKDAYTKKLVLEEERKRLILSEENNYAQMQQRAVGLCDMLEAQLAQHQYAASAQYSLADVVWTIFLARLVMIKFDYLLAERKNLSDYWLRMSSRKSYAAANICTKIPPSKLIRIIFALLFRA